MKIVFMGTPEFSQVSLERLLNSAPRHQVVGVLTQPDRPKGRGMKVVPSPVKEVALRHGLPVFQPQRLPDPEVMNFLETTKPDAMVVVAYGLKIPAAMLTFTPYGCINLHSSLLPKYRGASPIQWALLNGDQITGVTTMQMDEGWDTGDMLMSNTIRINEEDNFASLHDRLADLGADLLVETLHQLAAGGITPTPQNEAEATYARKLTEEDLAIEWSRSSRELFNKVRALNPWPGARTELNGEKIKVWSARISTEDWGLAQALPGTIGEAGKGENGIPVRTGDGALLIDELQLPGRKRLSAAQFLAGNKISKGMRFIF